jgi:hypothetical protein
VELVKYFLSLSVAFSAVCAFSQRQAGDVSDMPAPLVLLKFDDSVNDSGQSAAIGLVPQPKDFNIGKQAIAFKPSFSISNDRQDETGYADWLKADLERIFGWKIEDNGKAGVLVEFKHQELNHGNEAYKIDIASGRITITIAAVDGGYRAVGRLLSIFDSSFVKINPDGVLECRDLKITDWPDMPMRGMHLQMAYPSRFDAATRMEIFRRTIDTMARLGFNFAVFEIGGCFESLRNPDVSVKGYWTQAQLKELIQYAKVRGIAAYPGINSIGHVDRGPQLFLIKDSNGRNVAMDITHPGFYAKYFSVLDELSEIFGQPKYFHIGTDESNAAFSQLISKSGKPGDVLYSEFVNKISSYLKSKNIRTVIWHDMLLSQADVNPGEPANGKDTFKARNLLNKDIIIDEWCYDPVPGTYRGLELLAQQGNEIWVSPWNSHPGTRQLIQMAEKMKVRTVLGTTWSDPMEVPASFVHIAEYAWNAAKKELTADYNAVAVFNQHFNNRPDRFPGKTTRIEFKGAVVNDEKTKSSESLDFAGLVFPADRPVVSGQPKLTVLPTPADVRKAAAVPGNAVYILDPRNRAAGMKLDGVDVSRGTRQAILYTPAYGASSRTNPIGLEWIFRNGKIESFAHGTHAGGNQRIFPDGGVISVHDFSGPKSTYLRAEFNIGDPVAFASLTGTAFATPIEFKADIPAGAGGVAVMVSATFIMIGDTESPGKFIVHYPDGSNNTLVLRGDFLQKLNPGSDGHFRCWVADQDFSLTSKYNPLVVYEWRRTADKKCPDSITLEVSPSGRKIGFTVVSAVSW